MGQYFYFSNKTIGLGNKKGIPQNGDLMWMPKLNSLDPDFVKEVFETVIRLNEWSTDDNIVAMGDGGDVVKWSDYRGTDDCD